MAEEEARCQKEFECGITELPTLIDNFKTEAENSLVNAEYILGLREDAPTQQVSEPMQAPEPEPELVAVAPAPQVKGGFRKVAVSKIQHDPDALV